MQGTTRGMLLVILFIVSVIGYAASQEQGAVTYEKDVKSIISKRCLSCHGSNAPTIEEFNKNKEGFKQKSKGPRMDTYTNLMVFVNGKDTGALMRRLDDGKNTKDGNAGNMYKSLGGTDAERAENLLVIKRWIGGWTLKRSAEITDTERKAIKALEK
jgi:hypothetical protein